MKRPAFSLNAFGLALLAVVFLAAAGRLAWRALRPRTTAVAGAPIVLRVGHFLLYDGVRESFDAIARDYERLHPGVRIEPVPVPMRQWIPWQRTQLVGGTAPDIMQLGRGTTDELMAKFYLPLTPHIEAPNPYNAGTPLAGLAWRNTFVDGLASNNATYFANLGETYGVPTAVNTMRVLFNRALLRELTGRDEVPATFEDVIAACAEAKRTAERQGRTLIPIASSGEYAGFLFEDLFRGQTQRLIATLNASRQQRADPRETSVSLLRGVWSFDTPAVRDGAGLIHDIGQAMQPGFLQLDREDALFPFLQGRALMLFTGAWDYGNIAREAPFPVGVFRLPPPASPERTRNVLGPVSEAERIPEWIFGITRACPHPAEALDFLRYFTAHANAARFAAAGRFIPAVLQIPPAPDLVPFAPAIEGAPTGFRFSFRSYGAGHAAQLISSQLHLLVGRDGSVVKFADAVRTPLPAALRRDLAAARRAAERDIRRFDSLAVFRHLSNPDDRARLDALLTNQTLRELQGLQDADVTSP